MAKKITVKLKTMKHFIFTLFFLIATSAFGQNAFQQKKIDYFVTKATAYFKLTEKQSQKLLKSRTQYFLGYIEIMQNERSGAISTEERIKQIKIHNQKSIDYLQKLTGAEMANLNQFLSSTRKEMNYL